MQIIERSDRSYKNMVQNTTDAMIQSQHDYLVVRVCQKAYVEAQQSINFVSDGHRIRSFQAYFCDPTEFSNYRSEKNVESD